MSLDASSRESTVRIVTVHPDLLGTYGDGGNAVVLAQRLRWRGIPAEIIEANSSDPLPSSGDIYCLGGGEDGPQSTSAALLASDGALKSAVEAGAAVLAVCAGFQVIGEFFAASDGAMRAGVGLIDAQTSKTTQPRAVGELAVRPSPHLGLSCLTGYENHGAVTTLGVGVAELGAVEHGVGNGADRAVDGALVGRIAATYMHGPVLARNSDLADLIASWVVGPLDRLDDREMELLRQERLGFVKSGSNSPKSRLRSALRRIRKIA